MPNKVGNAVSMTPQGSSAVPRNNAGTGTPAAAIGGKKPDPSQSKLKSIIVDSNETKSSLTKRIAVAVIGIIETVWVLGEVIYFVVVTRQHLEREELDHTTELELEIAVCFIGFLAVCAFISLILSAALRNAWMMMPYMIGQFLILIGKLFAAFHIVAKLDNSGGAKALFNTFVNLLLVLIVVVVKMLFWGVVYSYYRVVIGREHK